MRLIRTIFLLTVLLITALPVSAESSLNVITTTFPPYDFSQQLGAKAGLLLPPGADSHSFEPSPRDIMRIVDADLLITTGGEGDVWLENVLDSLGSDAPEVLRMVDICDTLNEELKEGMQAEAEEETSPDEHVWTSPRNAIQIVEGMADVFKKLDSANANEYTERAAAYIDELKTLDAELTDLTANAARKTLIFGDRFPFLYFVRDYGLDYYAAFLGCSTEVEPSASTVAFLIDKVKTEKIPVVLYLEFSNHLIADVISESTGARSEMIHSCHNVSSEDLNGQVSYLELMRKNETVLRDALY